MREASGYGRSCECCRLVGVKKWELNVCGRLVGVGG